MKKLLGLILILVMAGCSEDTATSAVTTFGDSLITNGDFNSNNDDGWSSYFLGGSAGSKGVRGQKFCFDITNKGTQAWNIQLFQDVRIEPGKRYQLRLNAQAKTKVQLRVAIERNYGDYGSVGSEPFIFSLTPDAKAYLGEIMTQQQDNVRLAISTGGDFVETTPVTVCIDNVLLREVVASSAPTPNPTTPAPTPAPTNPTTPAPTTGSYEDNLKMIKAASVRNRNHDNSPYSATAQSSLPLDPSSSPLFGSREEYVQKGEPGVAFQSTGVFRTRCEFSHFSYDDPIVYPNQPGAAHLHMNFGNTDVNAYSTSETLNNRGSSTCNGQELNRTGYWVPALFDTQGNVRIPDFVHVYYKGEGLSNGKSVVYPPGAAMIAKGDKLANNVSSDQGGTKGMGGDKVTFICTDSWNSVFSPVSDTMPDCSQSPVGHRYRVLKMHIKFPTCWNGQDASKPENWFLPKSNWYWNDCGDMATLPNLEYILFYNIGLDESTAGWYLSSDVDPQSRQINVNSGSSIHGDWWGGWHPDINKQWLDNCVNPKKNQAGGCGDGYLSDHGPDVSNPYGGPALKLRPDYTGPDKVSAETLYKELCPQGSAFTSATAAAYCTPNQKSSLHSHH
jgi:hypothetical protein